jgi:hypothetical protein
MTTMNIDSLISACVSYKTSQLIPYEQLYNQWQYYYKELIPEQNRWKQPSALVDLWPPHYVTTCIIHHSVLQHYIIFLKLGIKHIHLPTRVLILMVRTIFWCHFVSHSETHYCIDWKTCIILRFYILMLLSFFVIRFNYSVVCSYRYI